MCRQKLRCINPILMEERSLIESQSTECKIDRSFIHLPQLNTRPSVRPFYCFRNSSDNQVMQKPFDCLPFARSESCIWIVINNNDQQQTKFV
jgi:hypothetical protein